MRYRRRDCDNSAQEWPIRKKEDRFDEYLMAAMTADVNRPVYFVLMG
jgi:hypothetical protein